MSTYKNINLRDIIGSVVSTFLTGVFLSVGAILSTQSIFTVDWKMVISSAIAAGLASLTKKYFTDDTHKLFGVVKV